jgi:hypothetical protein
MCRPKSLDADGRGAPYSSNPALSECTELSSQPPNSAGLLDFHRVLEIAPLLHVGGIVGVHQDPESSNLTGLRNIRDAIPFPRTPDNVDF